MGRRAMSFERSTDALFLRLCVANPKKTRSRLSGTLAKQEYECELPTGANYLRDDGGITLTVCYAIFIIYFLFLL